MFLRGSSSRALQLKLSGACIARLVIEKPALALEAAAIAGQRTVAADHAMAWHDQADRVLPVGESDGAHCIRLADLLCQRAIGRGCSACDLAQRIPDLELERRARKRDLQRIDRGDVTSEISFQHLGVTENVLL